MTVENDSPVFFHRCHRAAVMLAVRLGAVMLSLGVTAPALAQSLAGTDLTLSGATPRIVFDKNAGTPYKWQAIGVETGFVLIDVTANKLPFGIQAGAPTSALFLATNGHIGFGTDAPQTQLHVVSNETPSLRLEQSATPNGAQIWDVAANEAVFAVTNRTSNVSPISATATATNNSLFVGANGNIGLGTNSPQVKLHLRSGGDPVLRFDQGGENPDQIWDMRANEISFILRDQTSNTVPLTVATTAPTNSVVIAPNGSVGIGTAAPNTTGAVNSPGKYLNVRADGNTAATGVCNGVFQGSLGAQNHLVHLNAPANQKVMRLQCSSGFFGLHVLKDNLTAKQVADCLSIKMSNGNLGLRVQNPAHPLQLASGARCTTGGVFTNASSRELKQDIELLSLEQARDTVRNLEPVSYRYKSDTSEQYVGFIAEDVPELVATGDRKGLAAMDITAVLTKVVQDQDRKLVDQDQQLGEQSKQLVVERLRNDRLERLIDQQQTLNKALLERLAKLEQKLAE